METRPFYIHFCVYYSFYSECEINSQSARDQYKPLTSGFDLNNAIGNYRAVNGIIVTSLINKPNIVGGEVTVSFYPAIDTNLYGMQILRHTARDAGGIYIRSRALDNWSAWKKLLTE